MKSCIDYSRIKFSLKTLALEPRILQHGSYGVGFLLYSVPLRSSTASPNENSDKVFLKVNILCLLLNSKEASSSWYHHVCMFVSLFIFWWIFLNFRVNFTEVQVTLSSQAYISVFYHQLRRP